MMTTTKKPLPEATRGATQASIGGAVMALVVKFSTLADGVFIEETGADDRSPSDRCFRFDSEGRAEWAAFGDLVDDAERARWYGFQTPESQFIFC